RHAGGAAPGRHPRLQGARPARHELLRRRRVRGGRLARRTAPWRAHGPRHPRVPALRGSRGNRLRHRAPLRGHEGPDPARRMTVYRSLDPERAAALERLCELIVPGSGRVGSVVYVDAVLAAMPPPVREHALEAIDKLGPAAEQGAAALAEHERTPEFAFVR